MMTGGRHIAIAAAIALMLIGFFVGELRATHHAQARIEASVKAQADATSDRDAARATLTELRRRLDRQADELDAAQRAAAEALAHRDAATARAQAAERAAQTLLRNRAHASPECADLARLPVCPVISDSLWGRPTGDPATGGDR